MNDSPVVLSCKRIFVFLAQEPHVICVFQLGNADGVSAEFCVVQLDSPNILIPAMDQLILFVASDLDCHLGRGNGKGDEYQGHHEEHPYQEIALFSAAVKFRLGDRGREHR